MFKLNLIILTIMDKRTKTNWCENVKINDKYILIQYKSTLLVLTSQIYGIV